MANERSTFLSKKLLFLIPIFVIAFIFVYQKPKPVAEVTVLMKEGKFEPENIEIKKNTKVIFKNEDSVYRWPASNLHPTHGIYPEFDPQKGVEPLKEWSFVYNKVGSFKYHDHLMPSTRGVILVLE